MCHITKSKKQKSKIKNQKSKSKSLLSKPLPLPQEKDLKEFSDRRLWDTLLLLLLPPSFSLVAVLSLWYALFSLSLFLISISRFLLSFFSFSIFSYFRDFVIFFYFKFFWGSICRGRLEWGKSCGRNKRAWEVARVTCKTCPAHLWVRTCKWVRSIGKFSLRMIHLGKTRPSWQGRKLIWRVTRFTFLAYFLFFIF